MRISNSRSKFKLVPLRFCPVVSAITCLEVVPDLRVGFDGLTLVKDYVNLQSTAGSQISVRKKRIVVKNLTKHISLTLF